MDENTIMVAKIKVHLSKFSEDIFKDYFEEFFHGIQTNKVVNLFNISRSLNEEQPLINAEDWLTRNLDDVDFTDGINHEIRRVGGLRCLRR